VIREVHRFEGISGADDAALADAFGVYADPEIGGVRYQVLIRP
jgi:hypothetical protein